MAADRWPLRTLDDFDGAKVARDRQYLSKSLEEGIEAFRRARWENLRALEQVPADAWTRAGTQEGVGTVMLCDIPSMMSEHDAAHRREIEPWWRARTS